ncbi:uncharacterized protein PV09_00729 [Verruconis gallopava]|uniref:Major facilitator superfamily (MFS) profile domain-containing protein n=1 Tax=Verruconis gallopava TaxID=253628 RepID=A0A0D2AQJ1_9PEZI|nr:uncharacterized protein PV09_00729 [Verruconis gallopava]KIW08795.1 hypothetical protein PV09_00729 [Verruconis gallopava]
MSLHYLDRLSRLVRPCHSLEKDRKRPWLLHYRSSKWFILLTVTFAVFTDIFLYAVIVPVIPFALKSRAGIAGSQVQSWVSILIAVYGGALALASPICGWIADATNNRRLPLVAGLVALGASTIMLNLGRSIVVLVLGRILQGVSAAVVWCVGLALVADTVPTDEVGKSMGYVFFAMSVGMIAGPLLGGVVFDKGGYNAVFGMIYALIGVDIAMRFFMIETKDAKKWKEVEDRGKSQASVEKGEPNDSEGLEPPQSISNNTLDIVEDGEMASTGGRHRVENFEPEILVTGSRIKRRVPALVTLLKSRRLLCALWACLVVATLFSHFDSVLPLFVHETFGWDPTAAGLIFIPLLLPSFASPIIGWAVDKFGPRWITTTGFLLFAPIEVLLRFVTHDTLGQKAVLCVLLALLGLSLDFSTTPLLVEITFVVMQKEKDNPGLFGKGGAYAQAYGLFNFAWACGCLVGPIWAGLVREHAGWGTMTWSIGLLSGLTVVPVFVWTGGSIFDKGKRQWWSNNETTRTDVDIA